MHSEDSDQTGRMHRLISVFTGHTGLVGFVLLKLICYVISRLKHKDVFILIHKHNLFESISDKIVQLMDFDQDQAVNMLLDNINQIPVSFVVFFCHPLMF